MGPYSTGQLWHEPKLRSIVFQGGYHVEVTIKIFSKPAHHLKEAFFFSLTKWNDASPSLNFSRVSQLVASIHISEATSYFERNQLITWKRPNFDQIYELCIGRDCAWLVFNNRAQGSSHRSHTSKEMQKTAGCKNATKNGSLLNINMLVNNLNIQTYQQNLLVRDVTFHRKCGKK